MLPYWLALVVFEARLLILKLYPLLGNKTPLLWSFGN